MARKADAEGWPCRAASGVHVTRRSAGADAQCTVLLALTTIVLKGLQELLQGAGRQPDALRLIAHAAICRASVCPLRLRLQHTAHICGQHLDYRATVPPFQQDLAPCSKLEQVHPASL